MKQILLAVLSIVICGCAVDNNGIGPTEKEAEYKWSEWGNNQLISIVDDSLAVLAIYKTYFKEWNECGFEGCTSATKTMDSRVGLFLINYREKQESIWGDTLDYDLRVIKDYFRDSSVLVFDTKNNKFGFWKIGVKAVELMDYVDYSGYYENKGYRGYIYHNARPWTNGNILLFYKGTYEDSKLLLEIENKQLKSFEFFEEYEWLSECANWYIREPNINYVNMSYIGGEASCIKKNDIMNNFELTVNDVVMDTSSLSKSNTERITGWYGSYIRDLSGKIYKIDTLNFKFDSTYAPMWLSDYNNPRFYKNIENIDFVYYSIQDLLGINISPL